MNFEESDEFMKKIEKDAQRKKMFLMLLAACLILIITLFFAIQYYKIKDANTLKVYVNNNQKNISTNLIAENDGKKYFNMKELSSLLEYSYHQGEYGEYNEHNDMGYVTNQYCVVAFSSDSQNLKKYMLLQEKTLEQEKKQDEESEEFVIDVKTDIDDYEVIELEKNILLVNEELYISELDIDKVFDSQVNLTNPNRIYFNTLEYLTAMYLKSIENSQYKETSNYYENLSAILDDMLVVSDGKKWGVYSFKNKNEIISLKYDEILYKKGSSEFFVTADNYEGVVSIEGTTIIKPTTYGCIKKLMDISKYNEEMGVEETNKLYLVEKNKKYGVVNDKNEVVIYPEYDAIGLENKEEFPEENFLNEKVLCEELIPVKKDGKYGLVDIDGKERLKCIYDGFGYIAKNTQQLSEDEKEEVSAENEKISSLENTLFIPETTGISGIVVCKDGLYGIYDVNKKSLTVPCFFSKIFQKTQRSTPIFYLESNENEIKLEDYLEENNLKTVKN